MMIASGAPSSSLPVAYSQWLERVDSNNKRTLTPQIAIGVRALSRIASHLNFPGPWQAITSLFYAINILLVPSSADKFISKITHWPIISKLGDIKTVFQSSLLLLISTTFTIIGLKEACQLLGHSVKLLELGLNTATPWIVSACRINAFFQIFDIVQGLKLKSEINRILVLTKTNSKNKLSFCVKILETIERHRDYLQDWNHLPSCSKWIAVVQTQIKNEHEYCLAKQELCRLNEVIKEVVTSMLEWSYHHVTYQAIGFFANALNIAASMIINPIGVSVLILGASAINISREIWKNMDRFNIKTWDMH